MLLAPRGRRRTSWHLLYSVVSTSEPKSEKSETAAGNSHFPREVTIIDEKSEPSNFYLADLAYCKWSEYRFMARVVALVALSLPQFGTGFFIANGRSAGVWSIRMSNVGSSSDPLASTTSSPAGVATILSCRNVRYNLIQRI